MLCTNDEDCDPTGQSPACPQCKPDETCTRVLTLPAGAQAVVPVGQSIGLLRETVRMRNVLPDTAKIKDTWQATVFIPQVSAEKSLSYKVRGRPQAGP